MRYKNTDAVPIKEEEEKPMNKLKSEDVMKALECCGNSFGCHGKECPHYETKGDCMRQTMKSALALLREKDAEIERLTKDFWGSQADIKMRLADERDEAITEFHRKYHEHLDFMNNINKPSPSWNTDDIQRVIVACGAIADQVKNEMKGATDVETDL